MKFNLELYKKYLRVAGVETKEKGWDVKVYPNGLYCFATRQKLGTHGEIHEHPYKGKIIQRLDNGEKYQFDTICIHWNIGFYYHASIRKLGTKSHGTVIFNNINSTDTYINEAVDEFHKKYKFVDE